MNRKTDSARTEDELRRIFGFEGLTASRFQALNALAMRLDEMMRAGVAEAMGVDVEGLPAKTVFELQAPTFYLARAAIDVETSATGAINFEDFVVEYSAESARPVSEFWQ